MGNWTTFEALVFRVFFSDLSDQPTQKFFSFSGVISIVFSIICRLARTSQLFQDISYIFQIRPNAADFSPDRSVKLNATDPIQELDALGQTLFRCLKLAQCVCRLKWTQWLVLSSSIVNKWLTL